MQQRNKALAAVAVAAIVVASGCLTVTVDSTVNNDGTISEYQLTMEMPDQLFTQMQSSAEQEGTTLEEQLKSNYTQSNYGSVSVSVDEQPDKDTASITITLEDFDPSEFEGTDFSGNTGQQTPAPGEQSSDPQINVTVEEDRIVYVDDSFNTPESDTGGDGGGGGFGGSFALEYSVTMPGQIIENETNADEIDGKTATWSRNGSDVFSNTEIRAVSKPGSGGGGDGLGLPGFGAGLAVVALLVAAGAMAAVRRRD